MLLRLPWPLGGVHLRATVGEHVVIDEDLELAGLHIDEDLVTVFDEADDATGRGLGRCGRWTIPTIHRRSDRR